MHSQTQIGTLNVTRADMFGIGPTIAHFGYNLHDLSWGVSCGRVVLAIVPIEFDKLREVHSSTKDILHGAFVKIKTISGQLEAAICKMTLQASHKLVCGFAGALADFKARNQFAFSVQSDKYPLVA